MAAGWTAAVIAVTLLACTVGLKAQGMTKGSTPPRPDSPSDPANPASSNVFSHWSSQSFPYSETEQRKPTNQQFSESHPTSGHTSNTQSHHQWNPPVIRPENPSSPQGGHQWTRPETQPASPLPSQLGNQLLNTGINPASPPASQTGGQWSGSGGQWSSSGNPAVTPQASQHETQWVRVESTGGLEHQQRPMKPLNCDVPTEVRVPCGAADISATQCEALRCCFDGQSCYFGKAVTVQCTKDGQFIIVVSKDSTNPKLDVASLSLLGTGQSCTKVDSNSQFVIYQFPVTKCGSEVLEEPEAIVYVNRLYSAYEVGVGPYGSITRDSQFELLFQCKYTASAVEPITVEVVKMNNPIRPVTAIGPMNVQLRLANGQCRTKGCNEGKVSPEVNCDCIVQYVCHNYSFLAAEAAYTSYYTEYPVSKVLRDTVYVEVQLMDKTDPLLVLRLGRCWVTTSPIPHTLPQWDILIDGCPYKDDRYLSTLIPIGPSAGLDYPSHYRRFAFKMFTFIETSTSSPLTQQIYIHCSTDVCDAKPGHNCEPSCYRRRRDVDAVVTENAEPKAVGSLGPILISKLDQ
ncbi:hypothetical protein WMY93_021534 [Mugilogobius chulae]|uniref:Zona pellucida sperm-binding protein 4 n=1 Tax=Mugilogobius chulae TaxID=88201 RepID=A0AAW0NL44_9GOBI